MKYILRNSALWLIRCYQQCISPLFGRRCRFIPTCSQYMYEAIQIHGFFKGIMLGIKRLLKCQPFYPGGYDPVPERKPKNLE